MNQTTNIEANILSVKKELDKVAMALFRLHLKKVGVASTKFEELMMFLEEHYAQHKQIPDTYLQEAYAAMQMDLDIFIERLAYRKHEKSKKKAKRQPQPQPVQPVPPEPVATQESFIFPEDDALMEEITPATLFEENQLLTRIQVALFLNVAVGRVRFMMDPSSPYYEPLFPTPLYIGKHMRFITKEVIEFTRKKQR